jgi:type I restriction-modification system DNA methylase subunit
MDFQAPYNRTNYIDFLRNTLLPEDFEKADESIRLEFKPQYTRQVTKIGHSSSLEMNVYEVEHGSENDPRVSLSKESFRLLAEHGQKRALVLFISKTPNYRFSLVTVDLELEGKKVKREYSNPRRLSFFLGPDAKIHTPQEYLVKPGRVRDFDDFKNRFSIEVVTKEFYKEYAEVFAQIESAIAKNNKLSKPDLRLYTQMLMNRLMFLRFLEKKKWVKFGESSDYLANLYATGGLHKQSFFVTRLCPLFFEALAIEGKQESDAVGKTVFLNGGLFEKSKLDEKVQDIPDTAFKNLLGPDGLFYKFNFTVEESTPIDIEVSVDPEMLGKVFEELVTGRHETGSYYTPRPIVSFMCKEALKGYLTAKTSAPKEAIELLVDEHEIAKDLTNRHAEEILFYLETIKAVDPACGSGAYLLGLLQELIEIRKTLQNQQLKSDPDFIYKLKLRLIRYCLYGVDIDPFATNIAKLRLWLSLSVEADNPQPLPNLDFKIETGDSILGPCDVYADRPDALVMSKLRQKAQQLVLKKDRYMIAHGEEKQNLYDEITAEEKALAEQTGTIVGEGVIAWHIHFAEVFTRGRRIESTFDGQFGFMAEAQRQRVFKITSFEPGGFDIVLANPPYVRQELIKEIKPMLREIYPDIFMGRADLYTYFYARSIELLGLGGLLSFISSNKWFRANYGRKLRKYISDKCHIYSITDFGELPVFETAATFPMIFVAQKSNTREETIFTQVKTLNPPYPDIKAIIQQNGSKLSIEAVTGDKWNITTATNTTLLNRMDNAGVPLKEYVNGNIFAGIKTGYNSAFWLSDDDYENIVSVDPACKNIIRPLVIGDNVRKWRIEDSKKWIIFTPPGINIKPYKTIIEHLEKYKDMLENRALNQKWYELQQAQLRYAKEFAKPKIIYPDIAKEPRFTLDRTGSYIDMTVFALPCEDLFLLGILNSYPAWKYLSSSSAVLGDVDKGGRIRLKRQYIENLPIPEASSKEREDIGKLVQKCLDAKGVGCEELETQIDQIVYKLYGLTADEIAIVEKSS